MTIESIRYSKGKLEVLDQLELPLAHNYVPVESVEDGHSVIKHMQVRGAPAIAIVGCLSLAVELLNNEHLWKDRDPQAISSLVRQKLDYLVTARPTAVNMQKSRDFLVFLVEKLASDPESTSADLVESIVIEIEGMLEEDRSINKAIGDNGAEHIIDSLSDPKHSNATVLTHCNTGSLATAGYGTALGVIRSLHNFGKLDHAYFTETRPYNQGARLTAYELMYDKIPSTMICDSKAGWLMKTKIIHAVVVGCDHVTLNGDVANKIGTYSLAVLALYHKVPFYVAMPTSTFNPDMEHGDHITIEERPHREMTHFGSHQIAAPGVNCWNPAFDVTPAQLITGGFITEHGIYTADKLKEAQFGGLRKIQSAVF